MDDAERLIIQKAMAYDLLRLLGKDDDKTYSVKELKAIIDAYVENSET